MSKKRTHVISICFLISLILLTISACNYGRIHDSTESNDDESMINVDQTYYCMDDFSSILIGESTIIDVYEIAPDVLLISTAYGAIGEYPTKNGYIRIEFYGSEHVVRRIEEIKKTGDGLREP